MFSDWIKRNRIMTETETFRTVLNYLRQGAITPNTGVDVDPVSWSGPIEIRTAPSGVAPSSPLHAWAANIENLTISGNPVVDDGIFFDSHGRLDESTDGLIAICDDRGKAEGQIISIEIVG